MDINDLTIDDIREQRPDLYQEIVKKAKHTPRLVTDDDVEEIIKPLFTEFKEETEKRVRLLENRLHLIVKDRMKDIMSALLDKSEKEKKKKKKEKKTLKNKQLLVEKVQRHALIGETIIWRPTGEIGKVVRFELDGHLRKIVLRLRNKEYIKVYDNRKMYNVVLEQ